MQAENEIKSLFFNGWKHFLVIIQPGMQDKRGAHLDVMDLPWISMANRGNNIHYSAISTFATHMIYAATKQIRGLKDYLVTNSMIEKL